MNDRTDRPTPLERQDVPDCIVAMALDWVRRPLSGLSQGELGSAIDEICLLIAQMRYRERRLVEIEQMCWIERVTLRLCQQCGAMSGYEGAVQLDLQRRVVAALLRYHDWREAVAPVVRRAIQTGLSDGGVNT
jgi:hypothetical protein